MTDCYYNASVLIVDDQQVNLSLMEKVLQELPVRVLKADSGKKALEIAEHYKPVLILLDVQMPGMNGFETLEELRKLENTANTPVIFITAVGTDTENIDRGYHAGAVDYIIKPVTPFILRTKVKIFLELAEQLNNAEKEQSKLKRVNTEYRRVLDEIRRNHGVIPVCSWCRKIKNEDGAWEKIEEYIQKISEAEFIYCVCPHCSQKLNSRAQKNKD